MTPERTKVEAIRASLLSALAGLPRCSERLICERFLRMADHALATWTNLSDAALFGPNWHGPAIEMAIRDAAAVRAGGRRAAA